MSQLQIEQLEAKVRALKELKDSKGWALMEQQIKDSIVEAALGMAASATMTEKEIDFRRGAIHTAKNLLAALPAMILVAENDVLSASTQVGAINPNASA